MLISKRAAGEGWSQLSGMGNHAPDGELLQWTDFRCGRKYTSEKMIQFLSGGLDCNEGHV